MNFEMSDEKDSVGAPIDSSQVEADGESNTSLQPMHMQLFSTWEVRKAPVNCVPRLCTLQVTRLEVTRPLEAGLGSMVLAASMKTPHRFLRSNEILVPSSGVITLPLELTFSLQYPHFLKRGGNVLQIRLQRRKRVRNRPLGGYKNLAIGLVDMSLVMQHRFLGEVKLYSEKVAEHLAVVTVGSLTSTAVDLERREHLVEASSDDDDEDIFSDDHIVSDSESGDNEHQSDEAKKKSTRPSASAVLRLLHLYRPSKSTRRHRRHADAMMMEEGLHSSAVTFASSPSDSEEEEEEEEGEGLAGATRPTLSPFFGSDRSSMVSLPTSSKSAEKLVRDRGGSCVARSYMSVSPVSRSGTSSLGTVVTTSLAQSFTTQPPPPKPSSSAPPGGHDEDGSDPTGARGTSPGVDCEDPLGSDHDFSRVFKKYDSLEKAIHRDSMDPLSNPPLDDPAHLAWDLTRGRVWCVSEGLPNSAVVVRGLMGMGEVVVTCVNQEMETIQTLLSIMTSVFKQWVALVPFCIALVGGDGLVSSSLQALSQSKCSSGKLRFPIIPLVSGLMSARLSSIDDKYQLAFPLDGHWLSNLKNSTDPLLHYVGDASSSLSLPMAQVILQRPVAELGVSSTSEQALPFLCNVSIGDVETSSEVSSSSSSLLPLTPTSPLGVAGGVAPGGGASGENMELILEYWNPKGGQKEKPSSVKVRSVLISYVDNLLHVTATKEKKTKGIRIRKPKETDTGGSVISLSSPQIVCRPVGKADSIAVMVDGVEREGVSMVKLQADWDLTRNSTFCIAVTSDV